MGGRRSRPDEVFIPQHHLIRLTLFGTFSSKEKARVVGESDRMRCSSLNATSSASLRSAPSPPGEGPCGRQSRSGEVWPSPPRGRWAAKPTG